MKAESNALALRIYREAAELRENGFSDAYIFTHLHSSGLQPEYAKRVIDTLGDFMASAYYTST